MASYVDNSSALTRFLFLTACPRDVEKTVGDDGVIKDEEELINPEPVDDSTNTDDSNEEEPTSEEPEEEKEDDETGDTEEENNEGNRENNLFYAGDRPESDNSKVTEE